MIALTERSKPGQDAGEVALSPSSSDVLQETTGGGIPRSQPGKGVALQNGNTPGQEEGQPHRRPGHLTCGSQECEDPRTDHGADADEGSLSHGQASTGLSRRPVRGRFSLAVGHCFPLRHHTGRPTRS
jgi:hypothetical protein